VHRSLGGRRASTRIQRHNIIIASRPNPAKLYKYYNSSRALAGFQDVTNDGLVVAVYVKDTSSEKHFETGDPAERSKWNTGVATGNNGGCDAKPSLLTSRHHLVRRSIVIK